MSVGTISHWLLALFLGNVSIYNVKLVSRYLNTSLKWSIYFYINSHVALNVKCSLLNLI